MKSKTHYPLAASDFITRSHASSHTHTKAVIIADVGCEWVGRVENCVSHSIRCNQSKHDSSNLHTCWCYFTHADQRSSWAWSARLKVLLDSKAHPIHFGTKPAKIIFLLHGAPCFQKKKLFYRFSCWYTRWSNRWNALTHGFTSEFHLPALQWMTTNYMSGDVGEAQRFVGSGRSALARERSNLGWKQARPSSMSQGQTYAPMQLVRE